MVAEVAPVAAAYLAWISFSLRAVKELSKKKTPNVNHKPESRRKTCARDMSALASIIKNI